MSASVPTVFLAFQQCCALGLVFIHSSARVLFTVFVLSNYKFLILPLTHIYPPHSPTCLFITYSFFQQTVFIQDQAPARQGRERQVKQTRPCPRVDEDRVPLLCAPVGLVLRGGRHADLPGPSCWRRAELTPRSSLRAPA